MAYFGTQPNDVKKNTGLYTPSEILQLEKDGNWGGSLELIEEQNITSTVEFINFTDLKESVYDVHLLEVRNVHIVSGSPKIYLRFSTDSGTSYIATGYQYAQQRVQSNASYQEDKSTSATVIQLCNSVGGTPNGVANFYCYLYNLGNSAKYSFVTSHSTYQISGVFASAFGGGVLPQANTVNAFRLQSNLANIFESAEIKLYGVKQI